MTNIVEHFELGGFVKLWKFHIRLQIETFLIQSFDTLTSFHALISASQFLEFFAQVLDKHILLTGLQCVRDGLGGVRWSLHVYRIILVDWCLSIEVIVNEILWLRNDRWGDSGSVASIVFVLWQEGLVLY